MPRHFSKMLLCSHVPSFTCVSEWRQFLQMIFYVTFQVTFNRHQAEAENGLPGVKVSRLVLHLESDLKHWCVWALQLNRDESWSTLSNLHKCDVERFIEVGDVFCQTAKSLEISICVFIDCVMRENEESNWIVRASYFFTVVCKGRHHRLLCDM